MSFFQYFMFCLREDQWPALEVMVQREANRPLQDDIWIVIEDEI